MAQHISELDTPNLLLDKNKLIKNIAFARSRACELGVQWRPHLKTHKCVEVARLQVASPSGPATVSTVREAEYFCAAGITDLIYAVGLAPHKLPRIAALNAAGADVKVVLDNAAAADALSGYCLANGVRIGALIEVDCDGHRSGVKCDDPGLVDLARRISRGGVFKGVLTHAGESYSAKSPAEVVPHAEREVRAILTARDVLRSGGFACDIVSVGSTPTLNCSPAAEGVTEYRSGVGTFNDLVMAGIGVCRVEDIAISVLVSVIGHQKEKGWVITDGGFLAMSRDRGTAAQAKDCGYGLVCDINGQLIEGLYVRACNQEHGIICHADGGPLDPSDWPIDTKLRILPNHACPTAAAFEEYKVIENDVVLDVWKRCNRW